MTDRLDVASSPLSPSLREGVVGVQSLPPAWQRFEPVLARLQAEAAAHFGTAHARLVPLAYEERPFSHLLRVAVCRHSTDRPDLHVFIKIFKAKSNDGLENMRQRVVHDFHASQRFSAAMPHGPQFAVVRPVACYQEHLAIVTEQAHGDTLVAYLESRARWFPRQTTRRELTDTLSRIGRWLLFFQAIEPVEGRVSLRDLREYVDLRLRRLTAHRVFSPLQRQRILDRLDTLSLQVPAAHLASVPVHGDFAPGNILVSQDSIAVLDLAMIQRGSSLHDISRLYLQLDALQAKPHFRRAVVEILQSALLRGFDETLTPARPLFRYLLMLHRINHLGTLALNAEPFPASALSRRVRRIHLRWIERELQSDSSS